MCALCAAEEESKAGRKYMGCVFVHVSIVALQPPRLFAVKISGALLVGWSMSGGGVPTLVPEAWSLKKLRSISRPFLSPAPNPTLMEVNEWVWPSHCHQHAAVLRHGQLLRWMDVAACLSGERTAHSPQCACIVKVVVLPRVSVCLSQHYRLRGGL